MVLFGGVAAGEGGEDVTLGDLYLIEVQGAGTVRCAQQEAAGAAPPARWGALLQEHGEGKLLLYGGVGADGKPLGDAWLLDVASLTWLLLYDGTPETSGLPVRNGRVGCLGAGFSCCSIRRLCAFAAAGLVLYRRPLNCGFPNSPVHRPRWRRCTAAGCSAWPLRLAARAWTWRAASTWWRRASPSPSWPRCGPRCG